jgi:hypothetical protein
MYEDDPDLESIAETLSKDRVYIDDAEEGDPDFKSNAEASVADPDPEPELDP